jgi:hypothetical protein
MPRCFCVTSQHSALTNSDSTRVSLVSIALGSTPRWIVASLRRRFSAT